MSDNFSVPAILGGVPVRSWPVRRTPERAVSGEYSEGAFFDAWLSRAPTWEPDSPAGGLPVGAGLASAVAAEARSRFSDVIAGALGWEQAAFAAEFAAVHAFGQDVIVVPANNGTRIITDMFAAFTKQTEELGIRPLEVGDEVLVPALTWQATAGALLRRNLVPVLVDVDESTLCMSVEAMASAVTDRTAGVFPVHLYNRMAPMSAIAAFADSLQIACGEDCAHAHGARFKNGQAAGTVSHGGSFSKQGSKTLAGGEGGALLTTHRGLAFQTASAVTCGRGVEDSRQLQADNDRMPAIVAALLRAQLRRFAAQNASRVQVFGQLDALAAELPGISPLAIQPEVEVEPTYKWPFRVDLAAFGMTIEQIRRTLEADLLCEVARIYEPLTWSPLYAPHSDPALRINDDFWRRIDRRRFDAPVAERAYDEVLVIEHAAGLDDRFPTAFADAIQKSLAHAPRLAHEVTA